MISRKHNKKIPAQEIIEAFIVTNEIDGTVEKSTHEVKHSIKQSSSEYVCLFSAMSNVELFMYDQLSYNILHIRYNKIRNKLTAILMENGLNIDLDKFKPLEHYKKVNLTHDYIPGSRIMEITLKDEKELIEILQILKPHIYMI